MTPTKILSFSQSFNARTFANNLRTDTDFQGDNALSEYLIDCLQALMTRELKQNKNSPQVYKDAYTTIKATIQTARQDAPNYFLDGQLPDHVTYALCAIAMGYSHQTPPPGPGPKATPNTDAMPTHPMGHDPIEESMSRLRQHERVLHLFSAINAFDGRTHHILNLYTKSNFKKDLTTDGISENPAGMMAIIYDINFRLKQGVQLAAKTPEIFLGSPSAHIKSIINAQALTVACRWPNRQMVDENIKLARHLNALLSIQHNNKLTIS